uniref:protein NO VEIN-like isoform X1 n=1 Tax=Erigeron canadensis TaxID=72917 RepID=UPI001CB8BE6F|nr:protein NO VEIN-like isoform X1 [Erigeron canadensis]
MLDFYIGPMKPKTKNKALNKVIRSYPNVGLLNVAIASIKFGLWDHTTSAHQKNSKEALQKTSSPTCALDINMDVGIAEKEAPASSKHVMEDCSSTFHENKRSNGCVVPFEGKKISEISFCTTIAIHRTPKMWMVGIKFKPEFQSVDFETAFIDDNAVDGYTWRFIQIWKDTCEKENVVEAFSKMLAFYHGQMKPKKKTKALSQMIMSYPYVGLLNVAIASIKFGLWDRMSTIPQANRGVHANTNEKTCAADANMDVELAEKDVIVANKGVALEDILQHVKTYFMVSNHTLDNINSYAKKLLVLLREVYKLECSLTQCFSVDDFETLGFGDIFTFLAEHISLLPTAWRICLRTDEKTEKPSVRVCMSQRYLLKFLSEAANSLEENELLSKLMVSELLRMQFPSAGLVLVEDDFTADLLTTMSKNGDNESSSIVLFSANLSNFREENYFSDTHVGTNDAVELLLGAPMLVDLTSWSLWDYKFAPSLGPLTEWLLSDLATKELLCLVTKDGKVLRIDHSATVDSFLEAFLHSSCKTAVSLVSLIALYGGERNVPLSLLKCHAKNAFEVMLNVSSKNVVQSVPVASRFVLDCLCSLPKEFRSFAAELLVSALRSIIKDATMLILSECKSKDDHLMIHELGLLLGIVEWFDSYCSCLSESKKSLENHRVSLEREANQSLEINQPNDDCKRDRMMTQKVQVVDDSCIPPMLDPESEVNAANIIKSIRMEEFGLDPYISVTESRVLEKQHARLGRALHCLSEELYSQDSHFLLELVQNADDNVYPRKVEPTLTFILQEKSIVVLNNENGFSAENIRALCDVGNSTKKNASAGYIGKKGIGFKSVFRVTDAPEIHSNGFHIKFDLTEGQIGFVLPTIVPPCDIGLFSNLVSSSITDQGNQQNYNTCIVLPLKSKLTETSTLENITSMFSDLHPSLLLFLHRLECIKFRNMINDSFVIMRKEAVGNGLTNVYTGSKTLTWLVESRKLQVNGIRNDVKTTEISVAFALDVLNNGIYSPILDQQYVFAFLPLRTYGLKFIIQGDFILPSSREEVDGDSPWNQWLLSEFPSLFVNSEKSFCNLPSFKDCPGKGVSAFMSYVPLVGEVHGFFAMLPRMIMSKLCTSNCLLLEGKNDKWVPPCSVLRNWNEQVRTLLPDSLIQKHLGLGYLNKEIILPDSLARALGIKNYGPKVLVHMLSSLCCTKDGLTSMGLNWLSSLLTELYSVSLQNSVDFKAGSDIINTLRKTPFIPLLDGCYGSLEEGMIWMNLDGSWRSLEAFTRLFANLRIVDPALFDGSITENLVQMLSKFGVQRLSAHQVVNSHILPAICDKKNTVNNDLMTEYLSFIMVHLQSSCSDCCNERGHIISEVYNKAFILTNHGFVLPFEVPIHFNNDFGNNIDTGRLINGIDVKWYEVDKSYLKYPAGKSMLKWRKFLKDLEVTDFVQTVQVEKMVPFSSQFVLTNMMWQKVTIPPGSTVSDWESQELVDLVKNVSLSGDCDKCKYLLEVLDEKWDAYFSDKAVAYCNMDGELEPFKSSLVSALNDVRWVASSLDNGFYYPKDLYYDCETVCLILGDNAPYAVPKIQSEKLISSIGFKRTVTLNDALSVLEIWKRSATSFKASVSQMSRFYSFLWSKLSSSTKINIPNLLCGAFIFVPLSSASSSEVVAGVLLSPEEVYWDDTMINTQCEFSKMLSNLYPSLHDFFVNKCGVKENPPILNFLSFLCHLSTVDTPMKAAKKVFDVFVMWSDGFKSGGLSFEDVEALKSNLEEKEMKVLPTARDEWVSLHPSFGLVCWCDDEKLSDEFEELNNINFFSLCELTDEEKAILKVKVSAFMKMLKIPALSEIVTREAIYYGLADNSYQTSLVSWVLPYAQRYISNAYPQRYLQLKLSGFEQLKRLHIVVVDKLFYKNVIRRSKLASKKRHDINCLLQDEILYMTHESDSHTIFMELCRFLMNGNTELHLANFLHMLTTMTESGSTEEQIEAFVLNSQKVPKLLDEEPVWSIQPIGPITCNVDKSPTPRITEKIVKPSSSSQSKTNWPPSSWKTAPKFTSSCMNRPKLQADAKFDLNECSIEEHVMSTDQVENIQSSTSSNNEGHGAKVILNVKPGLVDQDDSPSFSQKGQLLHGTANVQQAFLTGRRGEELAFNYYSNKVGIKAVKWVNEVKETGLPYDIEVYDDHKNRKEFIEVKTTESATKDWFEISVKEWEFAVKKGESYSIARVVMSGDNTAKVSIFQNPARLCQIGQLQLAVLMSKEQKDEFVI